MPGEEGRKTILGAKLAVPSGHVSRSGGPRSGSDVSPAPLRRSLVIGSPAIGAFAGMGMVSPDFFPRGREEYRVGATLWILVYLATASGLFAARFDSCLGRMPEDGEPPPAGHP